MSDQRRTANTARPMRAWGAAAVIWVAVLAGCAGIGGPSGPVQWDSTLDLGSPGDVVETVRDVAFYPACGNEVLQFDGQEWFPFTPANLDEFPAQPVALGGPPLGQARASALKKPVAEDAVAALAQVAAPGPGDDTGTLMVYDGGFAYWTSASGGLDTWLTTVEIEYAWVC